MVKKIMKKKALLILTILVSIFCITSCMNTTTATKEDEKEKILQNQTPTTPQSTTTQNTVTTERTTTPDPQETTQTIKTEKETTPNLEKGKTPDDKDAMTQNNNPQDKTEKLQEDGETTGTKPDSLIQNELVKTELARRITKSFGYAYLEYSSMNPEKKEAYTKSIIENAESMGLKTDSIIKQIKETKTDVRSLKLDSSNPALSIVVSEANQVEQESKSLEMLQWVTNGIMILGLDSSYN